LKPRPTPVSELIANLHFEKTENPAAVAGLIRALREVIAELEAEASPLQSTAAGTRRRKRP